ncbi:hypothetical protein F4778DRAFT_464583 [Xylariomycetidae sp. FL2044]|nr:hypothetical protein F4778DRAFT_464583 [Xylariomycetidae sp. FL2044]
MLIPYSPFSESDSDSDSDSIIGGSDESVIPDESQFDPTIPSTVASEPALAETPADDGGKDSIILHARAYQLEMYEESLKRNIIVTMDTGSGKTQVAVLRIQAELERSPPGKIVWFMAPTVTLCEQQSTVLRSQIPAAQVKLLTGADGVDTWSDTRTWDDYLKNVQIIVSTHQVLLDALGHAFVKLDRLSLIIFDEAHNCTSNHPGSRIMTQHYHPAKSSGLSVPSILGLTASPTHKLKAGALDEIEQMLDAICRSPTIHRTELMIAANRPVVSRIVYGRAESIEHTKSMASLGRMYNGLEFDKDPYIRRLRSESSEKSKEALRKASLKQETPTRKELAAFRRKSVQIQLELGPWAADYYISTAIPQHLEVLNRSDLMYGGHRIEEKEYVTQALNKVEMIKDQAFGHDLLSDKMKKLIEVLLSSDDGTTGIIFVRETVTTAVLEHILSVHPAIRKRFRAGAITGSSSFAKRKQLVGELKQSDGRHNLEKFRKGKLDFMIATSVLEEGIDVPACNLVICFDQPANLKAYIQRRGRAREKESRLVLFCTQEETTGWDKLEKEMRAQYEEERRTIQALKDMEESESPDVAPFRIPESGAQLAFDSATQHLEHFCRVNCSSQYLDPRPYYLPREVARCPQGRPLIEATVVLPISLPSELRRIVSARHWFSEKNACKDAAFQAYIALYNAGLVNVNLMPLRNELLEEGRARCSTVEVGEVHDPWPVLADAWKCATEIHQWDVRLIDQQGVVLRDAVVSLPLQLPQIPAFNVFWDSHTTWKIHMEGRDPVHQQELLPDHSLALLDLAYGHRRPVDNRPHVVHLRLTQEEIPFGKLVGSQPIRQDGVHHSILIRAATKWKQQLPFIYEAWLPSKPLAELSPEGLDMVRDVPDDAPWLALKKWPRRRDFLHPVPKARGLDQPKKKKAYAVIPAQSCRMDDTHISNVYLGALIPSIVRKIEVRLVAEELCSTVLKEISFSNMSQVTTAITSSAAREASNYQRLEFLGDSVLKLLTTVNVMTKYLHEPEGVLSARKDRIVSNSRLCRSAIDLGLDRFILTKPFSGSRWCPLYIDTLLETDPSTATRSMSTKTLADVVESLIGAAYLEDDGLSKALQCAQLFIPEAQWHSLTDARQILLDHRSPSSVLTLPTHLMPLEELIGYSFNDKSLLTEAMTHASLDLGLSTGACMERLEFLGDAILDSIIVNSIWSWKHELSQREMHLLRSATVNADVLGFLAMEWTTLLESTAISKEGKTIHTQTALPFWKFMRHSSPQVTTAQREAEERHKEEREAVLDAMRHGSEHPWTLLAHLHIPKFFSDLFESLLGAVWVDSGSTQACVDIVERAGILPYLQRLLEDGVDTLHPKNQLGELAGRNLKTVQYQSEVRDQELFCRVLVDGQVMVEVGGGVSLDEVQTRAAHEAYQKILSGAVAPGDVVMTDANADA